MCLANALDNSNTILFSEEENRQIDEFSATIDVYDSKFILNYASKIQRKIANLPDLLLEQLKSDSSNEANELIINLLSELTKFTFDDNVLSDPMKNQEIFINLRSEYFEISDKIAYLTSLLKEQQLIFMQNVSLLTNLHEKGIAYHKNVCMFIEAGKRKLSYIKENEIKTSNDTPTTIDEALRRESVLSAYSRFENRINAIEKTRLLAALFNNQVASYIESNEVSLKKISKLVMTIVPKWEKKIKMALKIGDIIDLIGSSTLSNPKDFIDNNKTLSLNITVLGKTLTQNCQNRKKLDELYLLGKEIQNSLNN